MPWTGKTSSLRGGSCLFSQRSLFTQSLSLSIPSSQPRPHGVFLHCFRYFVYSCFCSRGGSLMNNLHGSEIIWITNSSPHPRSLRICVQAEMFPAWLSLIPVTSGTQLFLRLFSGQVSIGPWAHSRQTVTFCLFLLWHLVRRHSEPVLNDVEATIVDAV